MTDWPYSWPGTEGLTYDEAVWTALRHADARMHPNHPDGPFPFQTRDEWCARMAASRAADEARYLRDCTRQTQEPTPEAVTRSPFRRLPRLQPLRGAA